MSLFALFGRSCHKRSHHIGYSSPPTSSAMNKAQRSQKDTKSLAVVFVVAPLPAFLAWR